MSQARELILTRIRSALPRHAGTEPPYHLLARKYRKHGTLDQPAVIELFIDRLLDYDAEVIRVHADAGAGAAVETLLAKRAETRLVTPPSLPPGWLPQGCDLATDEPHLPIATIEAADAVLTGCDLAIASSGTIVLRHAAAQGRRVLTLLPDHHICVVRPEQIVESLPEAFARMSASAKEPWTTISGPSATSDIEMTRIRGVHGPRRLSVVLLG